MMRFTKSGRREMAGAAALAMAALWCLLPLGAARAQLSDNATISTQGTQFVGQPKPETPAPPPAPPPPRAVAPEPPRPAAVRAPPPPPPPREPSRFPSVVILLDASDSMLNQVPGRGTTQLEEAKAALIQVVRGMTRETQVQMWLFNTRLTPLTVRDTRPGAFIAVGQPGLKTALVERIQSIRTGGGTNLYQAIIKTLTIFGRDEDQAAYRSGERFPVLVVISDGEDAGKTGDTLESVLAARAQYPLVTINAIGFHISGRDRWFEQLCRVATRREGCATAGDQSQLRTILANFYRPSEVVGGAPGRPLQRQR